MITRRQVWDCIPELLLVMAGIGLRRTMLRTFDVTWGYDFGDHWNYILWFTNHWDLPAVDYKRETFHPPLFYFISGSIIRSSGRLSDLTEFSVACGALRLVVIWIGLHLYLPGRRLARFLALALSALMPSSIHVDGMVMPEALHDLLAALSLLLAPLIHRSGGYRRWLLALLLGLVLSLDMLTKASALMILAAVLLAALFELMVRGDGGWQGRLRRLAPWGLVLSVVVAGSGWYFARNYRTHGKLFLTSFDTKEKFQMVSFNEVPYLKRRQLRYFVDWPVEIYERPYAPTSRDRFWPVLIASTFADYYQYGFSGTSRWVPPPRRVIWFSRWSMLGGTLIALTTFFAWIGSVRELWRRREPDRMGLLLAPWLALLSQAHFAVSYPLDALGVVKGSYIQFAAPPLYGLFGVAQTWLWRRSRLIVLMELAAIGLVAIYTVYCRARFIGP